MPIETIYINNLEEKVPISKLKQTIRRVFGQCGTIVDIQANGSLKRRGQAFVTYNTTEESRNAVERFKDFRLFKNPINVSYARSNSDKVLRLRGETDKLQEHQRIRKKKAAAAAKKQLARSRGDSETPTAPSAPAKSKGINVAEWKLLPPHNILLLQGITAQHTKDSIAGFFDSSIGFTDVRYVGARKLAFIEFDSEQSATLSMESVEGKIAEVFGAESLLSYAKK